MPLNDPHIAGFGSYLSGFTVSGVRSGIRALDSVFLFQAY